MISRRPAGSTRRRDHAPAKSRPVAAAARVGAAAASAPSTSRRRRGYASAAPVALGRRGRCAARRPDPNRRRAEAHAPRVAAAAATASEADLLARPSRPHCTMVDPGSTEIMCRQCQQGVRGGVAEAMRHRGKRQAQCVRHAAAVSTLACWALDNGETRLMRQIRSKEIMSSAELAEIGSIALESTECEGAAERIIWALAGLNPEQGVHFTRNLAMGNRLEMLKTLGCERLPKGAALDEFKALMLELKSLSEKRNHVIHGSWGAFVNLRDLITAPRSGRLATPSARKRGKAGAAPSDLSANELRGLPEQIAKATERLWAFADQHWPKPEL